MPEIDQEFSYKGYHSVQSKCRLRVWAWGRTDMTVIVMFTELPNSGMSITNRSEHIATMVNKDILIPKLGVNRDRAIWIQHYPPDRLSPDGSFNIMTYAWTEAPNRSNPNLLIVQASNPSWLGVTRPWVEELIREKLARITHA